MRPAQALKSYDVDWVEYFVQYHCELSGLESVGIRVDQESAEFRQVLAHQSPAIQEAFHQRMAAKGNRRVTAPRVVHCKDEGIADILDCVRYVDSLSVSVRGLAKSMVLSAFGGRRGFRVARQIGRLAERCGLGKPTGL